ncbi:MAG: ferredoxin--NADP reductase [Pseudomonadota bacterium]
MVAMLKEKVTSVHHWTEDLFSFTTTRDQAFRFKNGHFTMIGLENETGRPTLRAYSIASANYEEKLEFFSIKVQDGPLTSRLQHLQPGDDILIRSKTSGTLIAEELLHGKRLFLISTGTGLAPFMSIIKDFEIYEAFEEVILVHGVRFVSELAYQDYITKELANDEFMGEMVSKQLTYYPTVTREPYVNEGRVTTLIQNGELTKKLNIPDLNPETDRFMLCGSPSMLVDMSKILEDLGFTAASDKEMGHYVVERAFTES